jgi:hypothetical protein
VITAHNHTSEMTPKALNAVGEHITNVRVVHTIDIWVMAVL